MVELNRVTFHAAKDGNCVTTCRRNITNGKPLKRMAVFADCQRRLSELSDLILRIFGVT